MYYTHIHLTALEAAGRARPLSLGYSLVDRLALSGAADCRVLVGRRRRGGARPGEASRVTCALAFT